MGTCLRRVMSLGGDQCNFPINFPAACLVPAMLIGEDSTVFNGPTQRVIIKHHADTFGNVEPCERQPPKTILRSESAHAGTCAALQPSGLSAGFGQ